MFTELKDYQSVKKVKAAPMNYHEAGKRGLIRDYDEKAEEQEGYFVLYEDGYESWSPKDAFEKGYVELLEVKAGKTYGNTCANGAKKNVKDIQFWGSGDLFELISKASSQNEGWMKSTKAMEIEGVGVVVQVTTQQGDNVAEALTFVPGAKIERTTIKSDTGAIAITSRKVVKA